MVGQLLLVQLEHQAALPLVPQSPPAEKPVDWYIAGTPCMLVQASVSRAVRGGNRGLGVC